MGFKMKYAIETKYLPKGTKRRSGILMSRVGFLVCHDTGNDGSTAYGNVNYYTNSANEKSASAHTFIDDQHIVECIPATTGKPEKAWHVVYDVPKDNQLFGDDANDIAIGVELCYSYQRGCINNAEAYKRYVWYLAYLCYKFGLDPARHITGHFILDPARKTDPQNALTKMGKNFSILIQDVVKEYKECTAQSVSVPAPKPQLESVVTEGDEPLKLEQWQFDMLTQAISEFREQGLLTSDMWLEKIKDKTMTNSELAFINTILISKLNAKFGGWK